MEAVICLTGADLTKPGVADALALLLAAIAGEAPPPVDQAEAAAPRAAVKAAPVNPPRKPRAQAPALSAPPAVLQPGAEGYDESWAAFTSTRPTVQQRFLSLVEFKGEATMAEVAADLGVAGKALGGLVGSLSRWAKKAGVALPYTAGLKDGARAWRWWTFEG